MNTPMSTVFSSGLRTAIDQALAQLHATEQRGQLTAGVSLTGLELSLAQRGPWGSMFGGYAKKLWGGGWEAGARLQKAW